VGLGAIGSIILGVSGYAGNLVGVFLIIGASFGPICGAMMADYLLAGCKWNGPRAGFNPAGWISWALGFFVGAADFIPGMKSMIPAPPVAAFIVGFILYLILAKAGMQSRTLEMPAVKK
jgi:cytosine permease